MPNYSGTITGTATLQSAGVSVTVNISEAVTASATITGSSFSGTEDDIVTLTKTAVVSGQSPVSTTETMDTGPHPISGSVAAINVSSETVSGQTLTTSATFSADHSQINETGVVAVNVGGVSGTIPVSGAASTLPPTLSVTGPASIYEGDNAFYTISLSGAGLASGDAYEFKLFTADNTAKGNVNYLPIDMFVVLNSQNNWTQSISIQAIQDAEGTGDLDSSNNTDGTFFLSAQEDSGPTQVQIAPLNVNTITVLEKTVSNTSSVISAGHTESGLTIAAGGNIDVLSGGAVISTTIAMGGKLTLQSGAMAAIPTVILSGGSEVVSAGGSDRGALISGGSQDVSGVTSGALIFGGTQIVESGGTASGTAVSSGDDVVLGAAHGALLYISGVEVVVSGGTATGTTVYSGGTEVLASGGSASGTTINSGGVGVVAGGGMATGMGVASGGIDVVVSGGTEIDTMMHPGGLDIVAGGTELVLSGHVITSTIVTDSGSVLLVVSGGTASDAIITSSGVDVLDGGVGSNATVTSSGVEVVISGGVAAGSVVVSGGIEVVAAGGSAHSLLVGGVDVVVGGGTESGANVESGGIDIVVSGTASGAVVGSGGFELVESGSIDSAVTISGGTFEVASGGSTGGGAVTFYVVGGGTLQLDASASFGGLVAGFGAADRLDLRDIAFGSGTHVSFTAATGTQSGTLTVTDGVHTASIVLIGQYMASQLTSASDGHGGTLIGESSAAAAALHPITLAVPPHA